MLAKCVLHTSGPGTTNIIINLDSISAFYPGGEGITTLLLAGYPNEVELDSEFDDFTQRYLKYKMGNIVPDDFEKDTNGRVIPKMMKFYAEP